MRDLVISLFGVLILVFIGLIASGKFLARRFTPKPSPEKLLMFLGYQDLDRCRDCAHLLFTYHQCLCGGMAREKVVVKKITYTDHSVEWEVIEPETGSQAISAGY